MVMVALVALVAQEVTLVIQEQLVNQETQEILALTVLVEAVAQEPMVAMLVVVGRVAGRFIVNQAQAHQEIMDQQVTAEVQLETSDIQILVQAEHTVKVVVILHLLHILAI